jgi:predicted ATP-grasp superfamily ATP-dependent carboligase
VVSRVGSPWFPNVVLIDTSAPVLVVCRGDGDIGIARTLGRLGVKVHLIVEKGLTNPVPSSRYWATRKRWDFSRSEEESVALLLDFGAVLQTAHGVRPILLTTSDWVAIFIERNSRPLQEQFVFPQPIRPIIRALANKWEMHLLANEHEIPTPVTVCPGSRADVEEFLQTNTLPCVVKPADPFLGDPSAKQIVYSRQELIDRVDREEACGPLNMVLQEFIPGDADSVWMCNGYFGSQTDRTVIFTGKKLRQVSPTGVASLAICVSNETVATQTRQLMERLGYRGCVGIGFRYDTRDSAYKLLDVNARVSGIFRLFAGTNEMDVVRACYLDLTGQDVPGTALQPGRKWMREDDVVVVLPAMGSRRVSIRDWVRSVRGVQEMHWFSADDPLPLLVWLREKIRRRLPASFRRVGKAG